MAKYTCRTSRCQYGPDGEYYLREEQCDEDREGYLLCPDCGEYVTTYRPVNRQQVAARGVAGAAGGALLGLAIGGPGGALVGTVLGAIAGSAAGAVDD